MAFQVGDIKFSGTVDNISFYHSVFGWLVRTKGGPNRKQFKTSPAFARARENSEEFTACARAASAVRHLVIKHTAHKDKTLYHRLMKLMRLLADHDQESVRGKRDPIKGMQTVQAHACLKTFKISESLCLYEILLLEGFMKGSQDKVKECKTPIIPSAALKRRRTKKFPSLYELPIKPTKSSAPDRVLKQIQGHTAFD